MSNLKIVFSVLQLFIKGTGSIIDLSVAKVTDYFFIVGTNERIEAYMNDLGEAFDVGKLHIGGKFKFNGFEITINDEFGEISMAKYIKENRADKTVAFTKAPK